MQQIFTHMTYEKALTEGRVPPRNLLNFGNLQKIFPKYVLKQFHHSEAKSEVRKILWKFLLQL